jgi:tetratricopeptide (TPR) repeat protein
VLHDTGDLEGAITAYREAIRHKPDMYQAHYNLGVALRSKDDLDGAVAAFREAIRYKPDMLDAHTNLVATLQEKGDIQGAIGALCEAIKVDPKTPDFYNGLAWHLSTLPDDFAQYRNGMLGVEYAEKAATLTERRDYKVIDTLAAAYAEVGRFEEAIKSEEEAIRLIPVENKEEKAEYEARLKNYREKKPWRENSARKR